MVRTTSKIRNRCNGFTLVELLIVIVILGILAVVCVAAVRGITGTQSYDESTAARSSLINIHPESVPPVARLADTKALELEMNCQITGSGADGFDSADYKTIHFVDAVAAEATTRSSKLVWFTQNDQGHLVLYLTGEQDKAMDSYYSVFDSLQPCKGGNGG